jgi:hypothetical protein
MEKTINKRLSEFIVSQKIDEPLTYKTIGILRQDWHAYLNSGKPITLIKIQKIISHFPQLDARWLLTGDGNMLNTVSKKTEYELNNSISLTGEKDSVYNCPICKEKERIILANEKIIETQNKYIAVLELCPEKNREAV